MCNINLVSNLWPHYGLSAKTTHGSINPSTASQAYHEFKGGKRIEAGSDVWMEITGLSDSGSFITASMTIMYVKNGYGYKKYP